MASPPGFQLIIGVIIFLMGLGGVLTNGGVILMSRKARVFNSGVGRLIRCEAVGALLYSLVFLFYVSPALILNLTSWQDKAISARFGHVAIFSHDFTLFSHTCISCNRFVASYFPSNYNSSFSARNVKVLVILIPILAFGATTVHFLEPCWLYMIWDSGFFNYEPEGCGHVLALYIQFPRNIALICICSAVDLASLAKLRIINERSRAHSLADAEWRRRHNIEVALMRQVCFQAFMYIVEFFTYFIISSHFSDPYVVFFLTTFAWQAIHTLDGFVVFLFNGEMRRMLRRTIVTGHVSTFQIASSGQRQSSK